MLCPDCQGEGERSKVYVGMSFTTLMGVHQYYDEDGKLVVDNPNKTTTDFSCSRGHYWKETR